MADVTISRELVGDIASAILRIHTERVALRRELSKILQLANGLRKERDSSRAQMALLRGGKHARRQGE